MFPPEVGVYVIIPLVQIAVLLGVVLLCVAYTTLLERKVIAYIQARIGPNRVGPRGILQPIADGIKLFIKEDIVPSGADKWVYMAAPLIVLAVALVTFAAVAFGPAEDNFTVDLPWLFQEPVQFTPWIIADVNLGLLYILAIASLGVYGIILAGWASNSKYSLLGGLRSASQVISYEVPLALALIGPLLLAGSLRLQDIVEAQRGLWFIAPQIVAFFIYTAAAFAETNRTPFDLPEAESELVAGFHTEYSGMKFALFFMAEYANMILVSIIAVTVFLGGWLPWLPFWGAQADAWLRSVPCLGVLTPLLWFLPKVLLFIYVFLWVRATFPRYRYDQLMGIGWTILIPLALANILLTGLVKLWL